MTNATSSGVEVDRQALKSLKRRTDYHGLCYFLVWLASLVVLALFVTHSIGTWLIVPSMLLYSCAIGVGSASISHECMHGTPFKTRFLNETVLWLSSVVYIGEPIYRRYDHAYHHTYTSITGKDTQLSPYTRPTWRSYMTEMFGFYLIIEAFKTLFSMARGRSEIVDLYGTPCFEIPLSERSKIKWNARAFLAIYAALAAWSVIGQTWTPVIYFFLPRTLGQMFMAFTTVPYHIGMETDTTDMRKTTRSVATSSLLNLFLWNASYHLEHHLYTMVPFHNLPKLHALTQSQIPKPARGFFRAHLTIIRAIGKRNPRLA